MLHGPSHTEVTSPVGPNEGGDLAAGVSVWAGGVLPVAKPPAPIWLKTSPSGRGGRDSNTEASDAESSRFMDGSCELRSADRSETSSQTRCAVPLDTSQANTVSERDLRAELKRALDDVDAGTLQAVLDALNNRLGR
jgi:hypothetical protein